MCFRTIALFSTYTSFQRFLKRLSFNSCLTIWMPQTLLSHFSQHTEQTTALKPCWESQMTCSWHPSLQCWSMVYVKVLCWAQYCLPCTSRHWAMSLGTTTHCTTYLQMTHSCTNLPALSTLLNFCWTSSLVQNLWETGWLATGWEWMTTRRRSCLLELKQSLKLSHKPLFWLCLVPLNHSLTKLETEGSILTAIFPWINMSTFSADLSF